MSGHGKRWRCLVALSMVFPLAACQTYHKQFDASDDQIFQDVVLRKGGRFPGRDAATGIFQTQAGRPFVAIPLETPLYSECSSYCEVALREREVANLGTIDYYSATVACLDEFFPVDNWDFKKTYGSPERGGSKLSLDVTGASRTLALKDETLFEKYKIWVRYISYLDQPKVVIAQVEITGTKIATWSPIFYSAEKMPDLDRFVSPDLAAEGLIENFAQEVVNSLALCVGRLQTASRTRLGP